MMFSRTRRQLAALIALGAFVFAQAVIAAMGCAALGPDTARGNVAIMPSGEPCEMMGGTPAPLAISICTPDTAIQADTSAPAPLAALPSAIAYALLDAGRGQLESFAPRASARILGPPPFRLTQRLRI